MSFDRVDVMFEVAPMPKPTVPVQSGRPRGAQAGGAQGRVGSGQTKTDYNIPGCSVIKAELGLVVSRPGPGPELVLAMRILTLCAVLQAESARPE